MKRRARQGLLIVLLAQATWAADWPGRKEDGSVLLPNGWSLRPAGRQVDLGDFPVNLALSPDGRFVAVLHAGYGPHEIRIVDAAAGSTIATGRVEEAFYGLAFSGDGHRLYASGAGAEVVRVFGFDRRSGALTPAPSIPLRPESERGIPAGLALDGNARTLYAANLFGHRVTRVDLVRSNVTDIALTSLAGAEQTFPEPAQPLSFEEAAVTKRVAATLDPSRPDAPFPYACALDERRQRLYVSLWARAAVAVVDLRAGRVAAVWPAEEHPNEMRLSGDGQRLFVANANRNTVSVLDPDTGRIAETILVALRPDDPPGATPNSLALSPDGEILYVANANLNVVAVLDVSRPGRTRSLGFIPTGWYPTSVRVTPDGRRLLVANGKGIASFPNPKGPQPGRMPVPGEVLQYIGGLMRGTLSMVELPRRKALEDWMREQTAQALRCRPRASAAPLPPGHPIPARPGDPTPIRHCLYVVKENRTYDQVFGDMREGNGDASLCLFPERVTPNHHALAREFVLLDNFYVESEVSADGHEWSMGAYATDFVEKTWPLSYGHNRRGKVPYPSEGNFPVAFPAGGYLWDRAQEAGVTYRSYGEFVRNGRTPAEPGMAAVPALREHFDPHFRGFDMGYSDLKRADRFIEELKRFEREGDMPRLQILRLPNDHTAGTSPGHLTPTACVAENDLALGRLVEAVSKSAFWSNTAIFVVEDDAQNGSDHVDAHRTVALVIGPHVRRGVVDSTLYATCSMLRTMELILGLKPMSQFDAAATPMHASFQTDADLRPYAARPAHVDLTARNPATAWGADESRRMNFAREDAADDLRLNEIVWRSVRGADHPMPPPVRAAFVLVAAEGDGDD